MYNNNDGKKILIRIINTANWIFVYFLSFACLVFVFLLSFTFVLLFFLWIYLQNVFYILFSFFLILFVIKEFLKTYEILFQKLRHTKLWKSIYSRCTFGFSCCCCNNLYKNRCFYSFFFVCLLHLHTCFTKTTLLSFLLISTNKISGFWLQFFLFF